MKSLIKNYIDLLSVDKLNEFGIKNDIHLTNNQLEYLLNLIQNNWEDILKDETKYLDELQKNVSRDNFIKIKELVIYYKKRYKGYLF
ncbi:MAG: DUF2624 family protein [Bacilli bacterium]|nr:DUF2624 family protein [Bacilli bacterium]